MTPINVAAIALACFGLVAAIVAAIYWWKATGMNSGKSAMTGAIPVAPVASAAGWRWRSSGRFR